MPLGLRAIAENDLAFVLEDADYGFGWPITITDPTGLQQSLVGASSDIAQIIDPDTGTLISGRLATATLRISTLQTVFATLPEGVTDAAVKPWLVTFDDINEKSFTFKVAKSNPDRKLGVLFLVLETWIPLP